MKEFLRIFNKKTCLLLFMLCFINVGILILCADSNKSITLMGEELDTYLQEYPMFLERTIANSKLMAKLNVYQSGFSQMHLEKVAQCYTSLDHIQVTKGDNRGLVLFIQYRLTDIFLLIFLFTVVMNFFTERKKGLVYVVRSTPYGRGLLFLQRFAILGAAALLGMICLYGTSFAGICWTFGVDDLSRSLQSLPEFYKCPYAITIGEYLIYSCSMKFVGSFLAGILLYVVLGIFSQLTSYALSIAIIVFEITTAFLIEPVSSWNILRYVNLYTLMQADSYFKDCIFINVFGYAVSAIKTTIFVVILLLLLSAVVGFIIHGKLYVTNKRTLENLTDRMHRFMERIAPQRSLGGWEIYKLCICQGALFLLVALCILQFQLAFQYTYYYPVDALERLSYLKYHGELNEDVLQDAETEMALLKKTEEQLQKSLDKLLSKEHLDVYWYEKTKLALAENQSVQRGLEPVIENIRSGIEYFEKTGRVLHLIQPYSYDLLINRDHQTRHRAAFMVLITIVGSIAGIYAVEHQNHMQQVIHSSYRGRFVTHAGKPLIISGFCAISVISIHIIQLIHVGITLGFNDLDAPIQSLPFMRDFPLYVSIAGYFILLFLIRSLIAICFGCIIAFLSKISPDKFSAMALGVFLCMILFCLSEAIPGLSFCNPIYLLSADFFT